jgi:TPR repeat protein
MYFKIGRVKEALDLLKYAAEDNDEEAMLYLHEYYFGLGNYSLAFKYLDMATGPDIKVHIHYRFWEKLGMMYADGIGVNEDYDKAEYSCDMAKNIHKLLFL